MGCVPLPLHDLAAQAVLSRMLLHPNVVITYDCCTGMMDASRLQVRFCMRSNSMVTIERLSTITPGTEIRH